VSAIILSVAIKSVLLGVIRLNVAATRYKFSFQTGANKLECLLLKRKFHLSLIFASKAMVTSIMKTAKSEQGHSYLICANVISDKKTFIALSPLEVGVS